MSNRVFAQEHNDFAETEAPFHSKAKEYTDSLCMMDLGPLQPPRAALAFVCRSHAGHRLLAGARPSG